MSSPPLHRWSPLKPGDIVDIVAPGRGTDIKEVEIGALLLESWGLVPRYRPGIISDHFLFSSDDETRYTQLFQALHARDSAGIWCLRGGYGTGRLIPRLLQSAPPPHVKPVIGYSDITLLHLLLNQFWNWASLHAPILNEVSHHKSDPEVTGRLRSILFGKHPREHFDRLEPMNSAAKAPHTFYGTITGGNLSLVQTTIGTPWQIDTKKKVLLLEDIGEQGYSVDRMLYHCLHAGIFENVQAVLFGDFTEGEEEDNVSLVPPVLHQFAEKLAIPVLRIPHIGHGSINYPVPLGTQAILKTGISGSFYASLSCDSGCFADIA